MQRIASARLVSRRSGWSDSVRLSLSLAALGAAGACTASGAAAAENSVSAAYVVRSAVEDPSGTRVSEQLLTFGAAGGRTYVRTDDGTGKAMTTRATLDPDGLVHAETPSASLACFNLAAGLNADAARRDGVSSVAVRFNGDSVTMPVLLAVEPGSGGTSSVTARGAAEASFADAPWAGRMTFLLFGSVTSQDGALLAARIDESALLAPTGAPFFHTACAVSRVRSAAPPATARAAAL